MVTHIENMTRMNVDGDIAHYIAHGAEGVSYGW